MATAVVVNAFMREILGAGCPLASVSPGESAIDISNLAAIVLSNSETLHLWEVVCMTRGRGDRKPLAFKQRDISRELRGVVASGAAVDKVTINPKGEIEITVAKGFTPAGEHGGRAA
jgi:hypothetical protein